MKSQRRPIRKRQKPKQPQLSTRYSQNNFMQYQPQIRNLLSLYFNTLTTIYPTGASINILTSPVRPKRVLEQLWSIRLMRRVFQQVNRLHEQIVGTRIPPVSQKRYTMAATRAVSVPSDRDMTQLPGILSIQAKLRRDRQYAQRIRQQQRIIMRPAVVQIVRPQSYKQLVNVVGQQIATKINNWLIMQYQGHSLRTQRIQTQQLISQLFKPFGQGQVPVTPQVYMLGRLYRNTTYQDQVQLSNRLNSNFQLLIDQNQDQLQQQVLQANALLIFTSLYYALIPQLIGMLLLFRQQDPKRVQSYYSPLKGINLSPSLYYVYQTTNPQSFNTMIQSGLSMKVSKYIQNNKKIAQSSHSFQTKYRRLFSGVVRLFRLTYQSLNKRMIQKTKQWSQWQQYTTIDAQGNQGLGVKNINFNMVVPYIRNCGLQLNFPQSVWIIDDLLQTFVSFLIDLKGNQKLNWQFYGGKNNQINDYQFYQLQRQCVQKLNQDLVVWGKPQIIQSVTIQSVKQYCRNNSITLRFIGAQSFFYASKYMIVVTPSHIQLVKASNQSQSNSGLVAVYRPQQVFDKKTKIIAKQRNAVKQFILGGDLPYDDQIATGVQKQLRVLSMAVDIQCLALQQQRQIPYMINIVGYPGDNSNILYRSWTNRGIYRYYGTYQEQYMFPQNSWQDQYCIYSFVQWLAIISKDYDSQNPLYIWGFNSMGYQLTYLLLPLTQKFGQIKLLGHPSQCKSFKICGGRIVFCDILKILPIKKLSQYSKQFNLKVKKQQFDIGLIKTWQQVIQNQTKIRQYCYIDCVSTLLLVHKTQATLIQLCNNLKIPHDIPSIAKKVTASSLGWFIYVQGFLKKSITNNLVSENKSMLVNNQPFQVYQHQRGSYTGGIVQVYKYINQKKIYVVDVNSMYPAMMRKPLPWKYVEYCDKFVQKTLDQRQSDIYLYQITSYQLPATFVGSLVALKLQGLQKNCYMNSFYGGRNIYLRGSTIKRMLYHKASISFKSVHKYTNNNNYSLKEFAQAIYEQRLKAKTTTMKQLTKLMMNSVTGRCAMNQQRDYKARNVPSQNLYVCYDQDLYIQTGQSQLPPSGRLVRITAAITDYAKVYLDQLHQKAGYDNVLYCDTDSLMVTQQGYINLGRPGRKSTTLGQFKVQVKDKMMYDYYDAGYFKNRKDYILKFTNKSGQIQYLHKSKGIPKRYITKEYTQQVVRSFKLCQDNLTKAQHNTTFVVGDKINMQVWRRHPFDGTTIRNMLKKSTVIVDRFFQSSNSIGLPRNDKYIKTWTNQQQQ